MTLAVLLNSSSWVMVAEAAKTPSGSLGFVLVDEHPPRDRAVPPRTVGERLGENDHAGPISRTRLPGMEGNTLSGQFHQRQAPSTLTFSSTNSNR